MSDYGVLYVISAPSGAGKTSLVNALVSNIPDLKVSISYTTRPRRPGEEEDVNYHFVDKKQFKQMIDEHQFLEYADVFGHYYGTSRRWVEKKLKAGVDVILEIDWQGAQQIRALFPLSQSIFILPPSPKTLQARLRDRKQDSPEVIAKRLAAANSEIAHYHEFDYLIINDVFADALRDLTTIIQANRLRLKPQSNRHAILLSEFTQNE